MAPEVQGRGGDEMLGYTWSADLYSFVVTWYEILTGEDSFRRIRDRDFIKVIEQPRIGLKFFMIVQMV